jgi:AraC-type transcriptional regulator N-terminus
MGMGETTVELVTSCSRMMDLLGAPRDISFFGKLIQREIIYRLLQGSLGARLRAIATFETRCHRVAIGQLVPDCRKQALELSSHSVIEDDLDRIRKISPDKR